LDVRSEIEADAAAFPGGPDGTHLSQEVATCEAIVVLARALLIAQMLELQFDANGRAMAEAPDALKDSEYDQGKHIES
jgi:hypothetical protein